MSENGGSITPKGGWSNGQIMILISIGCLVMILSCFVLGASYFGISMGIISTPEWVPDSVRYETKPGFKMVASSIEEKTDIPLEKCLEFCDKDPNCMSVSYQESKKRCVLNHQNRESEPSSYSDWNGWDYYGKADVFSKFPVEQDGWMDTTGLEDKVFKKITKRDCLLKCVQEYKNGCKGFNYDPTKEECALVPLKYAGNELFFDGSKPVKFYSIK